MTEGENSKADHGNNGLKVGSLAENPSLQISPVKLDGTNYLA